ncbi:hypothetical protein L6452_05645 [Arctium lappa]|uniref:Uncharacterized protein n=1 Tax=Arctium lappa TaxID=4217 RepID=A0ACB9EI07_ARCLA|nr:hypothetical protein L6452_05645 [Arctium lappa]
MYGVLRRKDFNIMEEANGVGRGISIDIDDVMVNGSTLGIHLSSMDVDRLNSPHTSAVLFEVMEYQLQFFQEKNCRKGRFSPAKLKGKRVVELGEGCGVAGFGECCFLYNY